MAFAVCEGPLLPILPSPWSVQHIPRLHSLKHRPHIVPALVRQSDVCRDWLSVETFSKRDLSGSCGEGLGQSAPGEFKADATRQERPRVHCALEERFLPVIRRGEYEQDMRGDRFEEHQESPDDTPGRRSAEFLQRCRPILTTSVYTCESAME